MTQNKRETAEQIKTKVLDVAGQVADRAKSTAEDARAKVEAAIDTGKVRAGETITAARNTTYRAADGMTRLYNEHPLATTAAAAVAGAVIGALLPKVGISRAVGSSATRAVKVIAGSSIARQALTQAAATLVTAGRSAGSTAQKAKTKAASHVRALDAIAAKPAVKVAGKIAATAAEVSTSVRAKARAAAKRIDKDS